MKLFATLSFGVGLVDLTVGHIFPRASCGVSSVYSALSSARSGSSFCSTLLYPSTATVTVTVTDTRPCTTKTKTEIETYTSTGDKVITTVLPTITVSIYTSTVLIPSGTHRPVGKRFAQDAPASANPAGYQQCSPTPSAVCGCPSKSISAACSSLVASPKPVTSTVTDTEKCPKTTVTVTSTKITTKFTGTITVTGYPPPDTVYPSGVLTTTVPAACAGTPYYPNGDGEAEDGVYPIFYPDFPETSVECCVLCYDSERYPNCVASAFIEDDMSCELLRKTNRTAGDPTSKKCPNGIENYPFGTPQEGGNVFPGPCGY